MGKKLLIPCIVFCMLLTMAVFTQAADNKAQQPGKTMKIQSKNLTKAKPVSPLIEAKTAADPVIFTDDFEGTQPNWNTQTSWNHVETASGGRVLQDVSSWELTDANSNTPTHSWHAALGLDQELDFIVSPVIHLPTEVMSGGVTSPLKGLKLGYWLDVDTPEGTNAWYHLVGSAECWWHFTTTDPGAGTSSWYMEPIDVGHWRQWLVTPEINLTGAANLTFKHKYDSEAGWDYYTVDVSTDNFQSYTQLAAYDGSTEQLTWVDETIDLSAYAGQMVKIRFSAKGDYLTVEGFWGIDEIKVSDGTTDLFYDDGGEAGTTTIIKEGFAPGANFQGYTADGSSQPNPAWSEMEPFDVPGFGTSIMGGDSVRIAFQWETDGTATTGRGFFIDDVTLYGIGKLEYDLAVLGVVGFENAVVDRKANFGVIVNNQGLNGVTANLQWNGEITSAAGDVVWPAMFGRLNVTDFGPDSVLVVPTFAAREWLVDKPGDYVFKGTLSFAQDGDASNNAFEVDFTVFGPPLMNVVYKQDFEPRGGETSLEDFGFTVVNGGGCEATGLNDNKWEFGGIINEYGAILSWGWGYLDYGSDEVAPWDSSEVLDEGLITPEIDISGLGKHSTLFLNYYSYFRPSYPGYAPFGEQWSYFDIDFSIDGGQTWYNAFHWADDDSIVTDYNRLPNTYYGYDNQISYLSYLGVDLTQAVVMGGEKLHVRFNLSSDNSYFMGVSVEDIIIYSGLDHARITSVDDVAEDQGKQVRVNWKASFNDLTLWTEGMYGEFEEHLVTHYNLWREVPVGGTVNAMVVSDMKTMLSKPGQPGDSYLLDDMQYDFIATVPAHDNMNYSYVAPTLWDGVETMFMVSAHTDDPMVFVDSKPMGGTSVDNLAPGAPMSLASMGQNNTNILTWEASPDEDVKYYSVYRTETSGSYPSEPLAYATDLTYTDATAVVGKTYFYVITASDFGLNESERSNETSVLTGVDDNSSGAIPTEFALDQNYPNPFNPTTYFKYQLPANAYVTVTIFNTNGQEIKKLVSEDMKAGYHVATWDGTNNAGENVASGLYIYQMKAGSFSAMKKMMLVR